MHDVYQKSCLQKAYILLATCALSRAVHLELVPNMGSEALQRALERMFARRGKAAIILSDNFKTFKSKEMQEFASSTGISWRYNLEATPWWGGFFERLVGTTKRILKKMLGKRSLTYEELETALARVEAAINSRPLTYMSEEQFDPLTLGGGTILNRPVQMLYPIELHIANPQGDSGDPNVNLGEHQPNGDSGDSTPNLGGHQGNGERMSARPRRMAAETGELVRRLRDGVG